MTPTEAASAAVKVDGQNRVARTAGQTGLSGSVIVLGLWIARQAGWQGEMPAEVVASLGFVLTSAASAWMNRSRLRGDVPPS